MSTSPRRFFLPPECRDGDSVRLPAESWHHIHEVCKLGMGSRFEILTGESRAYLVEVVEAGKKEGRARILESRDLPAARPPFLTLAVSLPRFATLETILQKAVELGVHSLLPFSSDHSFSSRGAEKKKLRWEKIIQMATQQSGRGEVMKLGPVENLDAVLQQFRESGARGVFAYEGKGDHGLKDALADLPDQSLWLFVGSEGGFSESEVERFRQAGLAPVSLGPRILRVETACLALTAVLQYELKQLG